MKPSAQFGVTHATTSEHGDIYFHAADATIVASVDCGDAPHKASPSSRIAPRVFLRQFVSLTRAGEDRLRGAAGRRLRVDAAVRVPAGRRWSLSGPLSGLLTSPQPRGPAPLRAARAPLRRADGRGAGAAGRPGGA